MTNEHKRTYRRFSYTVFFLNCIPNNILSSSKRERKFLLYLRIKCLAWGLKLEPILKSIYDIEKCVCNDLVKKISIMLRKLKKKWSWLIW